MKKSAVCLALLFLMSFSLFAKEELVNLEVVFPCTTKEGAADTFTWGLMGDIKYMRNEVWGYNIGGYFSLTEDNKSEQNTFMNFILYAGLPVRIFNNSNFNLFVAPQLGIDMGTNFLFKNKDTSIDSPTYFWIGESTDLDFKIMKYLYLTGGLSIQYYFYGFSDGETNNLKKWYFIPKLGFTLVW